MDPQVRILIADNHYFFRDGLRLLIENTPDFELVDEVTTAGDAINSAKQYKPNIVLMEIDLIQSNGIEATKQIFLDNPNCFVLILTNSEDEDDIFHAIQAGARGYLLKNLTHDGLRHSIRLIASGNAVFDSHINPQIGSLFNKVSTCYPAHHFPELTNRENEVLIFVAKGLKNKQIATECSISEKTVRNHVTNILSKLGVANRGEAISRLQQSCPSF